MTCRRETRVETDLEQTHAALAPPRLAPAWLKRLGVGGFLFFLIKGLLWLLVPAVLTVAGLS
jgi:hypothetical protein